MGAAALRSRPVSSSIVGGIIIVVVSFPRAAVALAPANSGTSSLYHASTPAPGGQAPPVVAQAPEGSSLSSDQHKGFSYGGGASAQDRTYHTVKVPTFPPGSSPPESDDLLDLPEAPLPEPIAGGDEAAPHRYVGRAADDDLETHHVDQQPRVVEDDHPPVVRMMTPDEPPTVERINGHHHHRKDEEDHPPEAASKTDKRPPRSARLKEKRQQQHHLHHAGDVLRLEAEAAQLRREVEAYKLEASEAVAAARRVEAEVERLVRETRVETEAEVESEWRGIVAALEQDAASLAEERDAALAAQVNVIAELADARVEFERAVGIERALREEGESERVAALEIELSETRRRADALAAKETELEERLVREKSAGDLMTRRLDIREVKHDMDLRELREKLEKRDAEIAALRSRLSDATHLAARLYFVVGGTPARRVADALGAARGFVGRRVTGVVRALAWPVRAIGRLGGSAAETETAAATASSRERNAK